MVILLLASAGVTLAALHGDPDQTAFLHQAAPGTIQGHPTKLDHPRAAIRQSWQLLRQNRQKVDS